MWSKALSKYPKHSYSHHSTNHTTAHKRLIENEAEYLDFLSKGPQIGDFLVYTGIVGKYTSPHVFQKVINIEYNFDKVKWDVYTGYPESHEIVGVGSFIHHGTSQNFYPLWRSPTSYYVPAKDVIETHLSVELQDNLSRAIKAFIEKRTTPSSS